MNPNPYERFEAHSDVPHHPYGFRGTWQFSSHSTIPQVFEEFLMLSFETAHISKIPIEQINELLNREWDVDAPSPYNRIWDCVQEMRVNGRDIRFERAAAPKWEADSDGLPLFSWDNSAPEAEDPEGL
jgi:hypothetical protein